MNHVHKTYQDKKRKEVTLILTDGGMGDFIAELVAVDWSVKNFPELLHHIFIPDYLFNFAQHVVHSNCIIYPFSEEKENFNKAFPARTTQWLTLSPTCIRTDALTYGFLTLTDRLPPVSAQHYLQIRPEEIDVTRFDLPEKYVCIQAAAAEPVKEMRQDTFDAVSDYVISRGYVPVYMGKENSETGYKDFAVKAKPFKGDVSKGINLLNKTNVLESAAIIAGSKCFIGMEGGLVHLAGCTDITIVAGFTLGDPATHAGPIRFGSRSYKMHAVEPDKDIPNRYFQTYSDVFQTIDLRFFPGWNE